MTLEFLLIIISVFLLFIFIFITFLVLSSDPHPKLQISHPSENTFINTHSGNSENFPSITDEPKVQLSVVIPAYNEELRLPKMLNEAIQYLETTLKTNYEIIVVDDGSRDSTTQIALEYSNKMSSDKLRVLTLRQNVGKGGAVRRGVLVSRGSKILFADADGATTFSELEKLEKSKSEIVVGSRAHLENESLASRSFFRSLLMKGFHACVWTFGCKGVKDTQCGFKLLTRSSAILLFSNLHIERWAFDVELLKIGEICGLSIEEVPVKWTEIDGSKLNPLFASIQMLKDLFLLWLKYSLGIWKIKKMKKE